MNNKIFVEFRVLKFNFSKVEQCIERYSKVIDYFIETSEKMTKA